MNLPPFHGPMVFFTLSTLDHKGKYLIVTYISTIDTYICKYILSGALGTRTKSKVVKHVKVVEMLR